LKNKEKNQTKFKIYGDEEQKIINNSISNQNDDRKSDLIKNDAAQEFLIEASFNKYQGQTSGFFKKFFLSSSLVMILCISAGLVYKIYLINEEINRIESKLVSYDSVGKNINSFLVDNGYEAIDFGNNDDESKNNEVVVENLENENNNTNTSETKYVVQDGDTLSSISQKFYGSENLYVRIVDRNKLTSENIIAGQTLFLPQD
jgi:LysM repeat protein